MGVAMGMARWLRWPVLLAAPLLLTSCLLVPAKFVSTLDIRADRSFTFTYVGEVQLLRSGTPDLESAEPAGTGEIGSWNAKRGDTALASMTSAQNEVEADFALATADSEEEAAQLGRLAEALSQEYGFRSARYIGGRKLAVDYRISGRLDHAFIFPFNPDGEVLIPFVAVELRGKDRVRIKAPGFANDQSGPGSMAGMGAPGASERPGSMLDGRFTLTTDADIVSQNQEDGAETMPDGTKRLVWPVNPGTRDAPMAVLRLKALP